MKGAWVFQWIVAVYDLLGRLMILSGFLSVLFSSNTNPGRLLTSYGYAIALPADIFRLSAFIVGTIYPSAATRDLALAATAMQAFGSISSAVAQLLITEGKKSILWLAVIGSAIMFVGGLLHAVNAYMIQKMTESEDAELKLKSANN